MSLQTGDKLTKKGVHYLPEYLQDHDEIHHTSTKQMFQRISPQYYLIISQKLTTA